MRGACIKCPNNAWMLILFFLIGGILLGLAGYILNKKQMVSWPLSFFHFKDPIPYASEEHKVSIFEKVQDRVGEGRGWKGWGRVGGIRVGVTGDPEEKKEGRGCGVRNVLAS